MAVEVADGRDDAAEVACRYRCRSRSILISAAVEFRHFLAGFAVALATL